MAAIIVEPMLGKGAPPTFFVIQITPNVMKFTTRHLL